MESCKHMNFEAYVQVARIEDKGRFVAEIHIRCIDCGTPFQFVGLKPGFDPDGATVSLDGLEANIGIRPQGARPNPMQEMLGVQLQEHELTPERRLNMEEKGISTFCLGNGALKCDGCLQERNWQTLNQLPDALRLAIQKTAIRIDDTDCILAGRPFYIGPQPPKRKG